MKVRIESISLENKHYPTREITKIYIDDKLIGEGIYGGEPEDNLRCRDYSWVEDMLKLLAEKLGAEVEYKNIEMLEDEYYK